MANFSDPEFGEIAVRRSSLATSIKVSVAPNGSLRVSMPKYTPLFFAKRLITSSRASIRRLQRAATPTQTYQDGMRIGKSHSILVHSSQVAKAQVKGQIIHVGLPDTKSIDTPAIQSLIKPYVIKALRKEANSYLPRRLAHLAELHNYTYERVRFSHASSRWGSCSSSGTISLNIALMKLDFAVIDYVLIHELAHTKQMNHSQAFWQLVEQADPSFRTHRKLLKNETPSV